MRPTVEDTWGPERLALEGHGRGVMSVEFSPDSEIVVSSSEDGTTRLWEASTGVEIARFEDLDSFYVEAVAILPDGQTIASGLWDSVIRLQDVKTGEMVELLGHEHDKPIRDVAFSPCPDRKILASISDDKTLRLWDISTKKQIRTLEVLEYSQRAVAFLLDGNLVAAGSGSDRDGIVRLWEVETGRLKIEFKDHPMMMNAIAFSPDRATVASESWDGSVKIWLNHLRNKLF